MRLIRDVLDNQLVDHNDNPIGTVDGIVMELRKGEPPVLKCIEAGMATKLRRFHRPFGDWLARRFPPTRIRWNAIQDIGIDVEVDINIDRTRLLDWEKRLRKIVVRIPGA